MKRILILAILAAFSLNLNAQSTDSELFNDLSLTTGIYHPYYTTDLKQTKAPSGYKPFFIEHVGRHGSRYNLNDRTAYLLETLAKADSMQSLTEEGRLLFEKLKLIEGDSRGRYGDLSQLGIAEHRAIAERMYKNFPQVFKGKTPIIVARSSQVQRCIVSMASFVSELRAQNPNIRLDMEAALRFYYYVNNYEGISKRDKSLYRESCNAYEKELGNSPERLCKAIFKKEMEFEIDGAKFMSDLFQVARLVPDSAPNAEELDIMDFFTPEELVKEWKRDNYSMYMSFGPSKEYRNINLGDAVGFVKEFVEQADKAIEGENVAAFLNFTHDSRIVPLTALINLNGFDVQVEKADDLYKVWSDYKVIPMGSNMQLIFYRNRKNDVLVKVLYNEQESYFPGLEPISGPYYRWADLRSYFLERIKTVE